MAYIIRRRRLGATSCRAIRDLSETGIRLFRNDAELPEDDLVFRWGCTSNVPVRRVVNRAAAIHKVSDKRGFRLLLDEHEIGSMETYGSVEDAARNVTYPVVVRPQTHSRGRNVHVCNTYEEMQAAADRYGEGGYYISPLVNKVAEYRVFCVSSRAICVAQKTPGNPEDVAWNVAQGGRFDNVRWGNWPLRAVKIALQAFELSELDFGGVDVMVDGAGECYILEINSAPSLTSPYRQQCFTKAFDYIVRNGKDKIPLVQRLGGYRKFIHPAVCEDAIVE